jgi:hypothetical protein
VGAGFGVVAERWREPCSAECSPCPGGDPCGPVLRAVTRASLFSADLDRDGDPELTFTADGLDGMVVLDPEAPAVGCRHYRSGRSLGRHRFAALGGADQDPTNLDLIGATPRSFLLYAPPSTAAALSCTGGQELAFGVEVADVLDARIAGSEHDDLILSGSRSRVYFGGPIDHTSLDRLPQAEELRAAFDLIPRSEEPMVAGSAAAGDLNGDRALDIALAYPSERQVRIWLGGNSRALTEIAEVIQPDCEPGSPMLLAMADLDADGRAELAVACAGPGGLVQVAWWQTTPR